MTQNKGPKAPNAVTIFGAGIAGLTAAHELVERGFHVQVWECSPDQRHPERGCDAGGLARTQWGAIDWPTTRNLDGFEGVSKEWRDRRAGSIAHIPHRFYIRWSPGRFTREEIKRNPEGEFPNGDTFDEFLQDLASREDIASLSRVTISAYGVRDLSPEERKRRAAVVLALAKGKFTDLEVNQDQAGLNFRFSCPSVFRGTSNDAAGVIRSVEINIVDGANPDWIDLEFEFESQPQPETETGAGNAASAANPAAPRTELFRRIWAPDLLSLVPIYGRDIQGGIKSALEYLGTRPHVKHVYLEISARRLDELSNEALEARASVLIQLFDRSSRLLGRGIDICCISLQRRPAARIARSR